MDLSVTWKNSVISTQLIRALNDRVLWHRKVANVVNDGTAT